MKYKFVFILIKHIFPSYPFERYVAYKTSTKHTVQNVQNTKSRIVILNLLQIQFPHSYIRKYVILGLQFILLLQETLSYRCEKLYMYGAVIKPVIEAITLGT